MLKKTTLVVLGLAATGITFAGSMGPVCTPGNVTVPCEAQLWSFGVDALYLKAVNSTARGYRTTPTGAYAELNNQWNWGVRASGSYQYSTGNDATITWLHYTNTEQQIGLSGFFLPTQVTSAYSVSNQNSIDQVSGVLGQHVDVTAIDKIRFYAGVQYASIQEDATNYYPVSALNFSSASFYDNANFKGVGPVVGIDYTYYVSPQLSLLANGATSFLYGTTRLATGYVLAPINLVVAPGYASKQIAVPGFEAKLGVNYAYNMAQGVLNIQGGYEVVDYFSVLQGRSLQTAAAISAVDYALYGPYVGLKYVGNA
jgi:hypothetical protein